jgi:hypothetical protein
MRHYIVIIVLFFAATSASAQPWTPWQVPTPRQTLAIPPDGGKVTFPQVDLVSGMKYSVHAEDRFKVASGNEFADARYYINVVTFPSGSLVNVGLKYQIGTAAEDWFSNAPPTQGYQGSHIYDASVPSNGTGPLTFRLFDRGEPPGSYYNDNSGNITVTVARETPGLAVKRDTVFFPATKAGNTSFQLDSIQGYGTQGYQLETVSMQGANPSVFNVVSQRTVPFGLSDQTNEFQFSFTPPAVGNYSAEFHMHSSSAWGADKDRIIYLIGQGAAANINADPDTLDFDTITAGSTKTLPLTLTNSGNTAGTVLGASMTPISEPFSVSGLPIAIAAQAQEQITVRFSPVSNGSYFARFDLATSDGSVVTFYAKGVAGQGVPWYKDNNKRCD